MDKKEYILTLLSALKKTRPMAEGLYSLVSDNALDDEVLDTLLQTFKKAVHKVVDSTAKDQLEKSIEVVDKIKSLEKTSQKHDNQEIKELDQLLKDF